MIEMRWMLDPEIPSGEPRWTLQYRFKKWRKDFLQEWSDWIDVPYISKK